MIWMGKCDRCGWNVDERTADIYLEHLSRTETDIQVICKNSQVCDEQRQELERRRDRSA